MSSEYLVLKGFIHNFQKKNCDRTTALEVTLALSLAACRGTLKIRLLPTLGEAHIDSHVAPDS